MNTPRTAAFHDELLGRDDGHADDLLSYRTFAAKLECELTAQIEGHKLTAKEASEAAVLRAEITQLKRERDALIRQLKDSREGIAEAIIKLQETACF